MAKQRSIDERLKELERKAEKLKVRKQIADLKAKLKSTK